MFEKPEMLYVKIVSVRSLIQFNFPEEGSIMGIVPLSRVVLIFFKTRKAVRPLLKVFRANSSAAYRKIQTLQW